MAYCVVVIVGASQSPATWLNDPHDPEQEPAEEQNACCPEALRGPVRSPLGARVLGYWLSCHCYSIVKSSGSVRFDPDQSGRLVGRLAMKMRPFVTCDGSYRNARAASVRCRTYSADAQLPRISVQSNKNWRQHGNRKLRTPFGRYFNAFLPQIDLRDPFLVVFSSAGLSLRVNVMPRVARGRCSRRLLPSYFGRFTRQDYAKVSS